MPTYEVFVEGKAYKVEVTKISEREFSVKVDGRPVSAELSAEKPDLEKPFSVKIDGKTYQTVLSKVEGNGPFSVKVEEVSFEAEVKTPTFKTAVTTFRLSPSTSTVKKSSVQKEAVAGAVTAPMTGRIMVVKVKKGEAVKQGQVVCVIEAMKMENEIVAPKAGTVQEVGIQEGSSVSEGETLLVIG